MGRGRKIGTGQQRSAQVWRSLVSGFANSGLGLAAYCAREGICKGSFYRWRALLGGRVKRAAVALPKSVAPEPAFVDLGPLAAPSARLELRVDLGGGVVLHIAHG